MAEYTFVAADVQSAATKLGAVAGAAIAAGQFIYLDAAGLAQLAQCDGTAIEAAVVGIALNSAALGQPVNYVKSGEVTVTAASFAGVGRLLALGTTAGKCMDASDLVATNRVVIIGWSTATNKLKLDMADAVLQYT